MPVAHASITIDYPFEYHVHGVRLFDADIKVEFGLIGEHASGHLHDWTITAIGVERHSTRYNRFVTHWLDPDDFAVGFIRERLLKDPEFAEDVREAVDAYLTEEAA